MPTITLDHVAKLYRSSRLERPEVLHANLTVEQGEFVFLAGPKGCGKSTLLALMAGEVTPDQGDVWLGDENLADFSRAELRELIGVVHQAADLAREETILDQLLPGRPRRLCGRRTVERAKKALSLVGMAGAGEKLPAEVTPSEYRRLQLARAILYSPSILLVDEIYDQMSDDDTWDLILLLNELNAKGTTVVMAAGREQRFISIVNQRVITLSPTGTVLTDTHRGRT